jgi:hypothetical protein
MDRDDLTHQIEDLLRKIREDHISDEAIHLRVRGLYHQTGPFPTNPTSGSKYSCTTTCPHCTGAVTVTLS